MAAQLYQWFQGEPPFRSLGYSEECMNIHLGNLHGADLGDGDGVKLQQLIARQDYFPIWGTCWESLAGEYLLLLLSTLTKPY